MSQHVDESVDEDPLLAFSTESGITARVAPVIPEPVQPAVPLVVTAPAAVPSAQSEQLESLNAHVERLEQRLNSAASELASLKKQVATLVGVIGDIKKVNRRPANGPLPRAPQASSSRLRGVSAFVTVVAGASLAFWGWTLSSRDLINAMGPSPAATVQERPATEQPAITVASKSAPTRIDYTGTLSIDAAPDAEVFIDRQPAGRTPLRMQRLKAGSHLVWIERDGYLRWTRVVQVPADRETRLSADLELIAVP